MGRNGNEKLSQEEFIELYNRFGPSKVARLAGATFRGVKSRAQRLRVLGFTLEGPNGTGRVSAEGGPYGTIPPPLAAGCIELKVQNGFVLVGSDFHYWPGNYSLMHTAFLWAAKEFKPKACILNGDVMDFPKISRHQRIGWENLPEVADEIEWAQEMTHEIAAALPRGCARHWTLGNHDKRFETRIANNDPELAKVKGVHLKDHFPLWEPTWTTVVNVGSREEVLIKHRFRGGVHAIHNNLLWTGSHIVTGHLHSAMVRPLTYWNDRTIWGMDTGCVAEPQGKQFLDYTEGNPKNWRSAFGILRFENGELLQPQLVLKRDHKRVQIGLDIFTP